MLFRSSSCREVEAPNYLYLYLTGKKKFIRFVNAVFGPTALTILAALIFMLANIPEVDRNIQYAIAILFTAFIAFLCATLTTAKRHDIFIVTTL